MASHRSTDFVPLSEEQFDFDISLSLSSCEDDADEDEVFLGAVSHKEKCISIGIEKQTRKDTSSGHSVGEEPGWSSLAEIQFLEISKEAHLLAQQIETGSSEKRIVDVSISETANSSSPEKGMFVEDSGEKLCLFGKADPALSPIKRETFCVQDSPLKQLPPAIQQRLLKAGGTSSPVRTSDSTSRPLKVCKVQPKSSLRIKAALPQTRVLPSKLAAPGSSQMSIKPKLAPPEKGKLPLQRSPRGRVLSGASSCEDLLSDTASVASDASDCSINISQPAKRNLPALRKAGHQRQAPMKAQALYGKAEDFRKTSSSSSSVSSVNSSLSASPLGKGKLNTSLNSSMNSTRARAPPGVSRLLGKKHPSPTVDKKPVELQSKPVKATPVKKPLAAPLHQTPKHLLERATSLPSIPGTSTRPSSVVRVGSKPKSIVVPTPSPLKGPQKSEVPCPDPPKTTKPRKLMSACSLESLNPKLVAPEGPQTPGGPGSMRMRRASALPTPASRRLSGIPMLTPKSSSRPSRPSQAFEKQGLPTSAGKVSQGSPMPQVTERTSSLVTETLPSKEASHLTQLQPCSLIFSMGDESMETLSSLPTPSSPECNSKPAADLAVLTGPEVSRELPQDCIKTPENNEVLLEDSVKKTPENNEVLLVDAPAPGLMTEERLLIDLTNTPDLIKMGPQKPPSGQLIDLSSPLITWSPVDKKESMMDSAPLINLSF